jgi:hypothetical protein
VKAVTWGRARRGFSLIKEFGFVLFINILLFMFWIKFERSLNFINFGALRFWPPESRSRAPSWSDRRPLSLVRVPWAVAVLATLRTSFRALPWYGSMATCSPSGSMLAAKRTRGRWCRRSRLAPSLVSARKQEWGLGFPRIGRTDGFVTLRAALDCRLETDGLCHLGLL